jgi:Nucleotidyl transferase AbiEii toxin, Type IV TA system
MNPDYVQTVNLLLDIAPTVFQTPRLAMKGGTALNMFVQDMPRLSRVSPISVLTRDEWFHHQRATGPHLPQPQCHLGGYRNLPHCRHL